MTEYWLAAVFAALSFAIFQLSTLGAAMSDQQTAVDALTAQVVKVGEEVSAAHDALVTELASVKEQLANAGVADQVDLSGLSAAIQAVDDLNPDVVVDPVVEEPVVEEPADEPVQEGPPF